MFDDNGENFIATLYNVLLEPDLCDRLFSIITLMNAGHTRFLRKGFCTVYFGAKEDNAVTLPHSAVRKARFYGKTYGEFKEKSKNKSKKKENFFGIDASEIRAEIYQIINSWRYCQCLGICIAKNRSRPFLHFMQNFFISSQK